MIANFFEILIFIALFFSIIYSFGVVWRVEKKLDLAFKLFLGSIIFFTLSEIFSLFAFQDRLWITNSATISKVIFAFLFLAGMLEMRNMLRKLDGEKK